MNGENFSAPQLRKLIRSGEWQTPTSGAAYGCVQANLVMMPKVEAFWDGVCVESISLYCIRKV